MNAVSRLLKRFGWMMAAGALALSSTACSSSTAASGGETPATTGGTAATSDSGSSGPSAPDFTLQTLDGDTVSLSDFEGEKVVLLDFWATTCDPCLAEMPELVALYKEKKAAGLEILAISTDGPNTLPQVSQVVKNKGMIFPILLDQETEVMDRYNPKGQLPFTVVINRKGKIKLKRASYTAGDTASMKSLVDAIDSALADK